MKEKKGQIEKEREREKSGGKGRRENFNIYMAGLCLYIKTSYKCTLIIELLDIKH